MSSQRIIGGISLGIHHWTNIYWLGLTSQIPLYVSCVVSFMCDVERMFHQFHVAPRDQDYLRFLWWEEGNMEAAPSVLRRPNCPRVTGHGKLLEKGGSKGRQHMVYFFLLFSTNSGIHLLLQFVFFRLSDFCNLSYTSWNPPTWASY